LHITGRLFDARIGRRLFLAVAGFVALVRQLRLGRAVARRARVAASALRLAQWQTR
jgi:hypothetical protein